MSDKIDPSAILQASFAFDAFDFSGADFRERCGKAGFKRVELLHLAGPCSAAIAYK